jgi:hypothetical protein
LPRRDEGPAILEDGVWTQQYVVTEMDSEEALAKIADQAHRVREERDRLLASCDWTQAADVPVDRTAWAAYRQLLRELPLQEGFPWSITWPDAP